MEWPRLVSLVDTRDYLTGMTEHTGAIIYHRRQAMSEEELEKKIHIAGLVGAFAGFVSGTCLMMLVAIIF
jgi:hypothetical protein